MQDFEKMGVFYLGKEYDMDQKELQEDLVLYKSKDLTTHGVIIGMTGSGKTGLGISLIEEAAMDNIPVIAIDPKGDIGNLKLTFPDLKDEDFRPWVNAHEAENKGLTPEEFAKDQGDLWRNGLTQWGQDGKRIKTLRNNVDINVYTPGSSSGIPVSVLSSFDSPSMEVLNDKDAYADRIQITTTSLLSLVGVNGDSLISREHILVANILGYYWDQGQSIEIAELINAIQNPPISKVGVMDIESFYPSKDRFSLAMLFNNLLASPGFESWLKGEPLNIKNFLYTAEGKPKVSVFTISHLSDSERMFFVTMLLNEILSWIRTQPGTGSLRAMLYMDEIFGYLPPTANPPSKTPLLTLLKQARAYGLGLLLSTQNPVDLDYKALSNCGTWFIGRLQTERDKDRVLAGLEGVAAGGEFDKKRTEQILAGLGKRVFYLHNVHQEEPVIFNTRWTMSYLAGPLTRKQIAVLAIDGQSSDTSQVEADANVEAAGQGDNVESREQEAVENISAEEKALVDVPTGDMYIGNVLAGKEGGSQVKEAVPALPTDIKQVYLPVYKDLANLTYRPSVIGIAELFYSSTKHKLAESQNYTLLAPIMDGPVSMDWSKGEIVDIGLDDLETEPFEGASYAYLASAGANPKNYDKWKKLLSQYARKELPLSLISCPTLNEYSEMDEDERDFRIRMQHLAHEKRDEEIDKLNKKYTSRINTLENRLLRAQQKVEKQNTSANQKKVDAVVSVGTAVIGALLGKKASKTSVSRFGTALKSTSRARKSGESISQAEETLQSVELELEKLQAELVEEIEKISQKYDMENEEFEAIEIRATANNITVHFIGLAWNPAD